MDSAFRIAIVGATGEVGKALLAQLDESGLAVQLSLLASEASEEETVMFRSRPLIVEALAGFDFSQVQAAVFAVPEAVAEQFLPQALQAGCRVIDHSTFSRLAAGVPLLIAGDDVPDARHVAVPGALAAILAPALEAVDVLGGIESAEVVLLSPVSSKGRAGVRELAGQTGELLNARGIEPAVFPVQIAFNTLPVIGERAAENLMDELEGLLSSAFPVALSEVRVPVFYGLTVSLSLRTRAQLPLEGLAKALQAAGLLRPDHESDQGVATPVTDASGQDGVYLAGLQELPAPLQGVQLWLVADNVRQGAARHSLCILENWIKRL